ncbi:MAG: hypothetical protein LBU32_15925 [Clostridiales bacterium]|nr:hypothetical protein [Clostridiales bacterium]
MELKAKSEQIILEAALINILRPKYNKEFIDGGKININIPELSWKEWEQYTCEFKSYLKGRSDKSQSIEDYKDSYVCLLSENAYVSTGIIDLDTKVRIENSNLILLSSVTGTGKTSLAICIAFINILRQNKKILYVHLKDSNNVFFSKMLSQATMVPFYTPNVHFSI